MAKVVVTLYSNTVGKVQRQGFSAGGGAEHLDAGLFKKEIRALIDSVADEVAVCSDALKDAFDAKHVK